MPYLPTNENLPPSSYGPYLLHLLTAGLHNPNLSTLSTLGNRTPNPARIWVHPRLPLAEVLGPTEVRRDILSPASRKGKEGVKKCSPVVEVWDEREGTLPGRRLALWIAMRLQIFHEGIPYGYWESSVRELVLRKMDLNEQILALGGNQNMHTRLPCFAKMRKDQKRPWMKDLQRFVRVQRALREVHVKRKGGEEEEIKEVKATKGETRAREDWNWCLFSFEDYNAWKRLKRRGRVWGAVVESDFLWEYWLWIESEREMREIEMGMEGLGIGEVEGK